MGKKKRQRKTTVYSSIEGEKSEAFLLKYLKEIYSDTNAMNFMDDPTRGGNTDRIVSLAIKYNYYDRSFAWVDEDLALSEETRQDLAKCWCLNEEDIAIMLLCPLNELQSRFNPQNRKPVLIVSQPVCVESLILKILGYTPCYENYDESIREEQIKNLKNSLGGVFGGVNPLEYNPLEYYRANLSKEILEERRRDIPELDLLIKMISK